MLLSLTKTRWVVGVTLGARAPVAGCQGLALPTEVGRMGVVSDVTGDAGAF